MIPLSTNTWPRHFEKIFEQKPRASTGAGDCCSLTNRGDIKGQKVKVERLPLPKLWYSRKSVLRGGAKHSKVLQCIKSQPTKLYLTNSPDSRWPQKNSNYSLLATFRAKQFVRLLWLNSARVDLLPFKFTLTGITYHLGIFLGGFHLSFQWFERFVRLLQWPFKSQQKSYRERRIHEV